MNGARQKANSLFSRSEEVTQLQQITSWAGQTTDGSLSDLELQPPGSEDAKYTVGITQFVTSKKKRAHVKCTVRDQMDGPSVDWV